METNTFKRIEALVELGQIKEKHGRELCEALALFIQVRLGQQVVRAEQDGIDQTPNTIDLALLDKMERDMLRDALHIVKGFKKHLALRYHLAG
ncbi:putative nucleotidyltransferase substrate binding domain-containing protein [Aliamphritea spongicola]|nr:putative nucleotidyltransferase substrate binding domain-containing protein [Aliamphritea spongicola]